MNAPLDAAPDLAGGRHIARYLVGEDPAPEEIARWQQAVAAQALPLASAADRRLWDFACRGRALAGFVDAGLGLVEPYSPVRQRLYLMLAVLEASPHHVTRFEARDLPPVIAAGRIFVAGAVGAVRSLSGLVLVLAIRALTR